MSPLTPTSAPTVYPGLEGIAFAETRLSHVDGLQGKLTIGGYSLQELAPNATFEEAALLLWLGHRPSAEELRAFHAELASRRVLPEVTLALLRQAAAMKVSAMDAVRLGADSLALQPLRPAERWPEIEPRAFDLLAQLPLVVGAFHCVSERLEPRATPVESSTAAALLHLLNGRAPSPERVRALDTYLVTVCDHGANASTFAARVIVSTRSDLLSAVVGALGALKGPLHGGAPGPALDMVFEIGDESRAEPYLRAKLAAGERLMGFGHRVYKVHDPRAVVLAAAADRLYSAVDADRRLYALARHVEATAIGLLDEYKPGRNLRTNVEFYTALLLHGLGLPTALFTPTFAIGRTAGWIAHGREQAREGRLIRPSAVYVGDFDRAWD